MFYVDNSQVNSSSYHLLVDDERGKIVQKNNASFRADKEFLFEDIEKEIYLSGDVEVTQYKIKKDSNGKCSVLEKEVFEFFKERLKKMKSKYRRLLIVEDESKKVYSFVS